MRARVTWSFVGLVDVVLINGGYVVAFLVRFGGRLPPYNWIAYVSSIPWLSTANVLILAALGLYSVVPMGRRALVREAAWGCVFGELASGVIFFWDRGFSFPRSVLVLGGVFAWMLVLGWRWFLMRQGYLRGPKSVLVVGSPNESAQIAATLAIAGSRVHSTTPDRCRDESWLRSGPPCELVVVGPSVGDGMRRRIATLAAQAGKMVAVAPDPFLLAVHRASVTQTGDVAMLILRPQGLTAGQAVVKQAMDFALSAILFVPFVIIAGLAGLVIWTTDGRPILYSQERVGQGGRSFRMWKLRTMIPSAEATTGPVLAGPQDPRVTRVGALLRRYHIDELPQIWNVLRGDMSLVGPRPERMTFVNRFMSEVDGYAQRFTVKPGITGFAQVAGRYATTARDKLAFDLLYIQRYNPLLDLQLLVRTIAHIGSEGWSVPPPANDVEREMRST